MADNFDAKDLLGDFQAMVNEAKKNMEQSMQEYTESVVDEIKKSDEAIKKAVKNQKPLDLGKLEAIAEIVIKSDNIDEATKQYATDVKNQVQKAVKKEKIKTEFEINPSFIIKKTSKGERIKTQTELEEHISKNYDKGTIAKDKKFVEYYSAAKELGYNISIPGTDSKEMEEYYNELISGNKELALHAEKAVEVLKAQVIELNNQKQAAIEARETQIAVEQAKRDELEKTNQALEEQRRLNEALQRELEETKAKMKESSTTLSQPDQSSVLSGNQTEVLSGVNNAVKVQEQIQEELKETRVEAEKTQKALSDTITSDLKQKIQKNYNILTDNYNVKGASQTYELQGWGDHYHTPYSIDAVQNLFNTIEQKIISIEKYTGESFTDVANNIEKYEPKVKNTVNAVFKALIDTLSNAMMMDDINTNPNGTVFKDEISVFAKQTKQKLVEMFNLDGVFDFDKIAFNNKSNILTDAQRKEIYDREQLVESFNAKAKNFEGFELDDLEVLNAYGEEISKIQQEILDGIRTDLQAAIDEAESIKEKYFKRKVPLEVNQTPLSLTEDSDGQLSFVEQTKKSVDLIEEESGQMSMFENVSEKATDSAIEGQMELNDILNKNIEGQITLNDLLKNDSVQPNISQSDEEKIIGLGDNVVRDWLDSGKTAQEFLRDHTSDIKVETDATNKLSDAMKEAADAKEKFAEANKEVENSAKKSSDELEEEAKSFSRVIEEASNSDWDKISQRMSDYGDEPFYESRQKTIKGSTSYKTSTETYRYNRDTEELELESVQIVNDMKKLRDEQIREAEKIKRASSQVQKFIASFDNKTLGKGEQLKGYSELKAFDITSLSDIEKAIVMMQNLDAEYNKVMQNFRKGSSSLNPFVNAINNSDKLSTSIKSIAIDFKSLKNPSDELKNKFGQLDAQLGEFNKSLEEDDIYGMSKAYGELKSNISQVIDLIKLQRKEESQQVSMSGSEIGTFPDFESARQGALEYARSLGEVTKELQYSDVPNKSGIYTMTAEIKDASGEVKKLSFNWKDAMSEMTVSSKFLRTELKGLPGLFQEIGKKVRQLGVYWAANFLNPMDLLQYGRTWFNFAKQYDDALTSMRKVSSETIGVLQDFQKESFKLADAVGTTASQLQNSTIDFLRLGESLEEAKQSAQEANILFNVSEFTNIDDATSSLISMGQAYNELDKMDIIDKLNIVGNNYAISTDELAQALQNSASALKVAGNDIDEAIALATTANTIVQDYSKVSAGIRTVSMRITGATAEELQEAGEDTEGLIETTAKLEEQVKSLTAVNGKMGVSLLDANGNFRSTYEILLDIAKVWEEIGEQDKLDGNNRQNVLLESLAGKNRASILAAILQSPDILESVYKTSSQDSEGSAQQELEKQLESISGHVAKLQNQWQNLWAETANRDVINFFLDLATSILKVIDGLGIIPTLLVGGGGIFAAIKSAQGNGKPKCRVSEMNMPLVA